MMNAREALFKAMLEGGWFIASDGDVESPAGYFGYVHNDSAELAEIYQAFSETVDAYGKPDDSLVIGSYFAWIDSQGFITIVPTALQGARERYRTAVRTYRKWVETTGE